MSKLIFTGSKQATAHGCEATKNGFDELTQAVGELIGDLANSPTPAEWLFIKSQIAFCEEARAAYLDRSVSKFEAPFILPLVAERM